MSELSERLRGIIKAPPRADVVPRANPPDLENLLEGRWYGHCFIVERRLPPSAKYEYGVSLGGPIKQDQVHYFFAYDGKDGLLRRTEVVVNPAPRTLRIIGGSPAASSFLRSRPTCTSTRFVCGTKR